MLNWVGLNHDGISRLNIWLLKWYGPLW